jgi:hypothetical protein
VCVQELYLLSGQLEEGLTIQREQQAWRLGVELGLEVVLEVVLAPQLLVLWGLKA